MELGFEVILRECGIDNYYIWWYGVKAHKHFFDENGFIGDSIELEESKIKDSNCIYIMLDGLQPYYSVLRGTYKIVNKEKCNDKYFKCKLEKVSTALDTYLNRLTLKANIKFTFYNKDAKRFKIAEIKKLVLEKCLLLFHMIK